MNIPREINRLRSKRWRLNQKFRQLINDNYDYYSIEVKQIINVMDTLDHQINDLKIGLPVNYKLVSRGNRDGQL